MAIGVHIPGWRFRRELLMSGISVLAVVRGAQAGVRTYRTGHHGRHSLASALTPLPVAWEFFPGVRLDGKPAAVVAGPNGVFLLEVKHAAGSVVAHSTGLIVRGKRDTRTVAGARTRASQLSTMIGRKVRPIIVITSGTVDGGLAGSIPVVGVDEVLGVLLGGTGAAFTRAEMVDIYSRLADLRS
jgi:hypothetical protein